MTGEHESLEDDTEFQAWSQRVLDTLLPTVRDAEMTIALVPRGPTDVKFAVELGFMIMLDKPIIALVLPGAIVPPKLLLVADKIVEADMSDEFGNALTALRIQDAVEGISAMLRQRALASNED